MNRQISKSLTAAAMVFALAAMTGCKSKDQKAVEQAESQAATTNTPQQVQWVDGNGNTVTKVVQPPSQQGQPATVASTNIAPPAAGQPKPAKSDPVITPLTSTSPAPDSSMAMTGAPAGNTAMTGSPAPVTNAPAGPPPVVNLTVPAGTELAIRINENISVKHTHVGDHFSGEVAEPVIHDGNVVIPRGTPVRGRVDAAHERGHFKGASILELRLTSMVLNGNEYGLDTHDNVHTKKGKGKRTAGWIGGLTGAGMIIGGVASGGVGLAIGAAAGAGSGTLIAGATGNRDIDIPAESIQHFRLADTLVVQNQ